MQVAVVGLCIVRLIYCAGMLPTLLCEVPAEGMHSHTAKQAASMHKLSGKPTNFGWTT